MEHKTKVRLNEPHPEQKGRWDTLAFHMPINPVHIAMMHTGKVLIVSGSGNDPDKARADGIPAVSFWATVMFWSTRDGVLPA